MVAGLWTALAHRIFPDVYGQSDTSLRVIHGIMIGGLLSCFVRYVLQYRRDPDKATLSERMKFQLSRSPQDRVALFLFSFITLVFCGFMFHIFFNRVPAIDQTERVMRIVMLEVYLTFALFAAYGLLWAIMTPRWLAYALRSTLRKVLLLVYTLVAAGIITGMYLYFALRGG